MAEIDDLRAALEMIDTVAMAHVRNAIGIAQQIARAALRGEPLPKWSREAKTWKPIPGYEDYEVSTRGEVRRKTREHLILKQRTVPRWGHKLVTIYDKSGKQLRTGVHRLVALTFIGPPPPGKPFVCHKNGRAWENDPENLYWGDVQENTADRLRHAKEYRDWMWGKSGERRSANV